MSFYTIGRKFHIGYKIMLYITKDTNTLLLPEASEYYKILYTDSGTFHIKLNGKEFILTGANALCLNEKDILQIYAKSDEEITILYFKPSVLNNRLDFAALNFTEGLSTSDLQDLYYLSNFRQNASITSKFLQLPVIDSTVIKQKLKQIEEQLTLQNSHSWPCRSRTFLFEILFSLVRPEERNDAIFSNQIEPNFSKLTINVIFFLQTSYNKKLTIENLAQIFHTNRTTLLADFKKSTGQSINRYLIQLRMTMASTLLRDTDLSINEICERTGFSDISYFSKSFKKIIQLTPTEYRRINVS